jgi:hypothetical protein
MMETFGRTIVQVAAFVACGGGAVCGLLAGGTPGAAVVCVSVVVFWAIAGLVTSTAGGR